MKILTTVLLIGWLGCLSISPLLGQSTATIYNQVFADLGVAPSTSANIQNRGQDGHIVAILLKDNAPAVCVTPFGAPEIEFQISWDNVLFFSDVLAGIDRVDTDSITNLYMYVANAGPFPFIRIRVVQFDTVNCLMDVYYSGTTGSQTSIESRTILRRTGGDARDDVQGFMIDRLNIEAHQAVSPLVFNGETWDRLLDCDTTAVIDVGAAATTEIVALAAGEVIYVCSVSLSLGAAGTAQFIEGTGADCVTAPSNVTGAYSLGATLPLVMGGNLGRLWIGTASEALCITTVGGGATAEGLISYEQYAPTP